jgi:hypothetical protein
VGRAVLGDIKNALAEQTLGGGNVFPGQKGNSINALSVCRAPHIHMLSALMQMLAGCNQVPIVPESSVHA